MSTWSDLETTLATAMAELDDDACVTLDVPAREPADGPQGIVVQVRREGTYLYAECTGGPAVGGELAWTDAEHTALLGLGWGTPPQIGARVYLRHFPGDDGPPPAAYLEDGLADEAVTLVVRTLRDVYGLADPAAVELSGS